jgi:hypothetical protein
MDLRENIDWNNGIYAYGSHQYSLEALYYKL